MISMLSMRCDNLSGSSEVIIRGSGVREREQSAPIGYHVGAHCLLTQLLT